MPEDPKPLIVAATRNEPVGVYLLKGTPLTEGLERFIHLAETYRRRIQIFSLTTGQQVTDSAFVNVANLIQLKEVGDVWLSGEREQVLKHYISLTEQMSDEAAIPELKRAIDLLQAELYNCEANSNQQSTG